MLTFLRQKTAEATGPGLNVDEGKSLLLTLNVIFGSIYRNITRATYGFKLFRQLDKK